MFDQLNVTHAYMAIGTVILVGGLIGFVRKRQWLARAYRTVGEVVGEERRSIPRSRSVQIDPIVKFQNRAGAEHTHTLYSCSRKVREDPPRAVFAKGELVDLFVDPEHPHLSEIDSFRYQWLGTTLALVFGSVFLLAGIFA